MKTCVLGAGSFGTALAMVLADNLHAVSLYVRDKKQANEMEMTRMNRNYLNHFPLSNYIVIANDLKQAMEGASAIILAVPSQSLPSLLKEIKPFIKPEQLLINVGKGFDNEKLRPLYQLIEEIFPQNRLCVLSGPSHAEEVAEKKPTALVAASHHAATAQIVQNLLMNENLRIYTSNDMMGVSLGGSLKNCIALAAGISDGLGYGDNAKAALMTRGSVEIARLGVTMGANRLTFSGLSGIGDLMVTCMSKHSRNRKAGQLLAKGYTIEEVTKEIQMVVEGLYASKSAYLLAKTHDVYMPIVTAVYETVFERKDPRIMVRNLMKKDKKSETNEEDLLIP